MKSHPFQVVGDHPGGTTATRQKLGLLIFDEDALMRVMLKLEFERRGFDVWLAGSRGQAEQIMRDHRNAINVLLADAQLAASDGADGARRARIFDPRMSICLLADEKDGLPSARLPWQVIRMPYQMEEIVDVVMRLAQESVEKSRQLTA
jgi:DNA-binding NtrC family response regulator